MSKKPLVEAAYGRKPDRYPIWFMRQAGRYLPEYRELRSKIEFVDLCQSPKLAAEVTLQPMRRFDLDAAIIFSDILIPPVGMGIDLSFGKGHGPQLSPAVRSASDLKNLKRPHAERDLGYVGEAITETKKGLRADQTMIGFAGAPFTVATYMIEGQPSKTYNEVKKMLFTDPSTLRHLLQFIAEVTVDYLKMQVSAGADVLMLFDTWAGEITPADYREFVKPVMVGLLAEVRKCGVPLIYFPGFGSDRMAELTGIDVDVVSVDWRIRLAHADRLLKEAGLNVTLQGNLDPQVLIAPEPVVRQRTRDVIAEAANGPRAHIFNVGHGLQPHTPPEALNWVIDEIRAH